MVEEKYIKYGLSGLKEKKNCPKIYASKIHKNIVEQSDWNIHSLN